MDDQRTLSFNLSQKITMDDLEQLSVAGSSWSASGNVTGSRGNIDGGAEGTYDG